MYVYKQFKDDEAYGEQIIELYEDIRDATAQLKKDVCSFYEIPYEYSWNEIKECLEDENIAAIDDTVTEDYVSISNGFYTRFWIVDEKTGELTQLSSPEWPMWNTMWQFNERIDLDWINNPENIRKMLDIGFTVVEHPVYGVFFGIDGAGYDFARYYWGPLYMARSIS